MLSQEDYMLAQTLRILVVLMDSTYKKNWNACVLPDGAEILMTTETKENLEEIN